MAIFRQPDQGLPGPSGLRAEAEAYAASHGQVRGTPGWGDAVRGYVRQIRSAVAGAATEAARREAPPRRRSLPPPQISERDRQAAQSLLPPSQRDLPPRDTSIGGLFRESREAIAGRFREQEADGSAPATPGAEPTFEDEWQAILAVEGGVDEDGTWKTSRKGAVGPAQILIEYGPDYAKRAGLTWDEHRARTDSEYNLALGRGYYAWLRHIYDAPTAAAAYNLGPYGMSWFVGRAVRDGRPDDWRDSATLDGETRKYVRDFEALLGLSREDRPPSTRLGKKASLKDPTRLTPTETDPWNIQSVGN